METKKKLNIRHEAFCREYHKNGFNGLQAYKKVYGTTGQAAEVNASKLLRNTKVESFLKELGQKAELRYGIDMEEIVKSLKDLAMQSEDGNRLKAFDMLIKVAGEYAPTKTDTKLSAGDDVEISVKLGKK